MKLAYANAFVLAASFLLEALLLLNLFGKHVIRRLVLFVALLSLYVLRGAVLFTTAGHISRVAQGALEGAFAVVDLGVQLALAALLFLRVNSESLGRSDRLWGVSEATILAFAFLLASIFTSLLLQFAPPYSPVPVDRGIVLAASSFTMVFLLSSKQAKQSVERALLRGFTLFAPFQVASQFGRATAAAHRQPRLFLMWAYMDAAAWLCVLLLWIYETSDLRTKEA